MLEKIHSPADLAHLSQEELCALADEIRRELIHTVSENGGHLASNLGVVELTIALHRAFDAPNDRIIFDVGHQSYVHKMLTGRYPAFHTLRQYKGISGFPKRSESEYDCFETGHASTSISAALGFARARDFRGEKHHVVAVVGDGALTGGMCYEALNDAGNSRTKLIVILNDNEMSIARNVGALSAYLTNLRISTGWQSAKRRVRHLTDIPVIGKPMYRLIHGGKKLLKSVLVREKDIGFFEALGFQYFGPINGHDIASLESTFEKAKLCGGPCVIHVLTRKGQGYEQAEDRPETFHGTPPFYVETGDRISVPDKPSCGHVMADTLAEMTETDPRIIAITAAMKLGTGLDHYADKYPEHVLDTGIAEEHAVTMAAGLAAGGMRPYVAVYATFFQRCYDQMIHDVCMQNLPVVFLLDRSGIGGEDGQTHHGVFDFSELLPIPNMTVLAPGDPCELRQIIQWSITCSGPCAIRYSKSLQPLPEAAGGRPPFEAGKWQVLRKGKDYTILAVGTMVRTALEAETLLREKHICGTVVNCSTLKPADTECLRVISGEGPFFTMEEHALHGGFGSFVTDVCRAEKLPLPAECIGIGDAFISHGNHECLLKEAGLLPAQTADRIFSVLRRLAE